MEPTKPALVHSDGTTARAHQPEPFCALDSKTAHVAPRQRVCFVLQVKPDRIEEYKHRHRAVWPEMLAALRETGWTNYSLFLRPDGLLIGYLETPDFDRARAEISRLEINRKWQSQMANFFLQSDGLFPDQSMVALEEIFHL
jgi:L-rhamnose mutarotase